VIGTPLESATVADEVGRAIADHLRVFVGLPAGAGLSPSGRLGPHQQARYNEPDASWLDAAENLVGLPRIRGAEP
jgi:hypothetical protein